MDIKKMMIKNIRICLSLLICLCMFCGCERSLFGQEKTDSKEEPAERSIFAMDTYMTITVYGEKRNEALDAAVREIQRLDALFSAQNEKSEVAGLNRDKSREVSEETGALLNASLALYQDTGGLFDITIYPLMKAWGFVNQQYKVPESGEIASLLQNVNAGKIQYDSETGEVTMPDATEIDPGGIAKGYTSSRIMDIFRGYGIQSGLVSLGGNVQVYGSRPDRTDWRVGIQNPDKESQEFLGILETSDKAVITSGGYERYFEKDGNVYHHILDPRTGYPADSGLTSVTIVSDDGTLADGLSTSLFIMGKEEALRFWHKNEEKFDAILLDKDGKITITAGLESSFSSDVFPVTVEKRQT